MSKKRLQEGDIFYVEHSGKYFFGRLVMDIKNRMIKREPEHRLKLNAQYIIETYAGIYDTPKLTMDEIIIPGQIIYRTCFTGRKDRIAWVYYDHKPVDYKTFSFPEGVCSSGRNNCLDFGELAFKLPISDEEYESYAAHHQPQRFFHYERVLNSAVYMQGRPELSSVVFSNNAEKIGGLRLYPEKRTKLYKLAGIDPNKSYYELAKEYGFDLTRFYEDGIASPEDPRAIIDATKKQNPRAFLKRLFGGA